MATPQPPQPEGLLDLRQMASVLVRRSGETPQPIIAALSILFRRRPQQIIAALNDEKLRQLGSELVRRSGKTPQQILAVLPPESGPGYKKASQQRMDLRQLGSELVRRIGKTPQQILAAFPPRVWTRLQKGIATTDAGSIATTDGGAAANDDGGITNSGPYA